MQPRSCYVDLRKESNFMTNLLFLYREAARRRSTGSQGRRACRGWSWGEGEPAETDGGECFVRFEHRLRFSSVYFQWHVGSGNCGRVKSFSSFQDEFFVLSCSNEHPTALRDALCSCKSVEIFIFCESPAFSSLIRFICTDFEYDEKERLIHALFTEVRKLCMH